MRQNKAFTFVEILLVIIIMAVILALAAPNFSKGYSHFELAQVADDLENTSHWAQAMAIGQGRIYALNFSDDHHAYNLELAADNQGIDDQQNFEPVKGPLGKWHALPETIILNTDLDHIEFYPDGTIDPATIQLDSHEHKILLSSILVRGMMTKVDDHE